MTAPSRPAAQHWDGIYRDRGDRGVSWFQPEPSLSLELIRALGVDRRTPVIDAGGGASRLADRLAHDGFSDVTVLDVSQEALDTARARLGEHPALSWVRADVLTWRPPRPYGLWHDRAVFHFLTGPGDRDTYLRTVRAALRPGAGLVLATFASDGPDHCSGLPVMRYAPGTLAEALGEDFRVVETRREEHRTPAGVVQPFTWIAARFGNDPPQ